MRSRTSGEKWFNFWGQFKAGAVQFVATPPSKADTGHMHNANGLGFLHAHPPCNRVTAIQFARPVPGFFLEGAVGMLCRTIGALLLVLALTPASADILVGTVVAVADGDTITLLDDSKVQHKIRLAGIDAPEGKQPFGHRAKEQLSDLVFGKTVQVEIGKMDRYGRQIGKVMTDGRDANQAMVAYGMAWHYKKYQTEQAPSDRLLYASAEEDARAGRVGLWRDPVPVAPWDWRRRK